MESLEIIVIPALLLSLTASLKLFVGRDYSISNLIESFSELPVDINFLSISFATTYLVTTSTENRSYGLCCCIVGMVISVLAIVLWRASQKALFNSQRWKLGILVLINISLSLWALERSTNLIRKDKVSQAITIDKNKSTTK
jgi:hypothetical protein